MSDRTAVVRAESVESVRADSWRPEQPVPSPRQVLRDLTPRTAANGLIAIIFSCTGPLAVIVTAAQRGGLSAAQLASWILGAFLLNGLLTVAASWTYRRPLAFMWTIPGTVLVGEALTHLPWAQVVGAYLVTAALILILGLSGAVSRVMNLLPTPVVMAMVAGVFVQFGVGLIDSVTKAAVIAAPMIAVFVFLSWSQRIGAIMPPVLGALLMGAAIVVLSGDLTAVTTGLSPVVAPVFTAPEFSIAAMTELVIPLAVTVIVVQNGQGIVVLEAAGHRVPITAATVFCGLWSALNAAVGAVSTCLTGPSNALLTASGERERQYTAGIVCGVLAIAVGLFAGISVGVVLALPAAFIAALAGLAMLAALKGAFTAAFSGVASTGALVAFLVTIAGHNFAGISAAFWGLVIGVLTARLVDTD
ncbi:benzoate/H(+) symporter BenE family transporter [Nocardia sp. R7R-8]|uniref:benzoate/H(+) symporter BenE family transporter n=1 Tax=Nocardia sp. R7R-8 TaxID=3459304 RepID=UPI00403D7FAA